MRLSLTPGLLRLAEGGLEARGLRVTGLGEAMGFPFTPSAGSPLRVWFASRRKRDLAGRFVGKEGATLSLVVCDTHTVWFRHQDVLGRRAFELAWGLLVRDPDGSVVEIPEPRVEVLRWGIGGVGPGKVVSI